ncbi:CUB and sushi domain-containing protein 3-like [Montipora capricornis]|uniref:CUB and sushi domain-containing protein 3-like n=1 Tax=Montipora capricornis TaxID=246305 RepID=UPI0035F1B613
MLVGSFYLWTLCTLFLMAVDAQPCQNESITNWRGDIYSPDYPRYQSNLDCYWLLQVAEGNLVEINFQDLSMTSFADDSAEKNGNFPNDYV